MIELWLLASVVSAAVSSAPVATADPALLPPCASVVDADLGECRKVSPVLLGRFWHWHSVRNWVVREEQLAAHAPMPRPDGWPASLDELARTLEASRAELDSAYAQGEREGWNGAPTCLARRGPVHFCGACARPFRIVKPRAAYTEEACRLGLQGVVILEAMIDESGRVRVERVLKGLPSGLSESARRSADASLFLPALLCGEPVPVFYNLTVNFRLSDGCENGRPIP